MHIASYLAYEEIQLEISIYGQSVTLTIGEQKCGNSIAVTLSSTQAEALTENLQAAIQILVPQKEYPNITVRRLWEAKAEKFPAAEGVETPLAIESGSAPVSIAA